MKKFVVLVATVAILLMANSLPLNDEPVVVITYPKSGEIFNATHGPLLNITGYAIDEDGIIRMEWIVKCNNKSRFYEEDLPMPYTRVDFELPVELFEGKNFIKVGMYDSQDNKGYDEIHVWYICRNLTAIANGPYYGKVGEIIKFNGSAYLGTPPYYWHWDFGDGAISSQEDPKHSYIEAGIYTVKLKVTDSMKNVSVDTTQAIIYEELQAIAGGPYKGIAGFEIQFNGSAFGGLLPYQWQWDFGDGSYAYEQNPKHVYSKEGNYTVKLTVIDSIGNVANDTTYATISPYDITPPSVIIVKPRNALYINNREIFPLPITIILGDVDIVVNAFDNIGIEKIEFYIDDSLAHIATNSPYQWHWDTSKGFHVIKVVAYDVAMNTAIDEKDVRVWKD